MIEKRSNHVGSLFEPGYTKDLRLQKRDTDCWFKKNAILQESKDLLKFILQNLYIYETILHYLVSVNEYITKNIHKHIRRADLLHY